MKPNTSFFVDGNAALYSQKKTDGDFFTDEKEGGLGFGFGFNVGTKYKTKGGWVAELSFGFTRTLINTDKLNKVFPRAGILIGKTLFQITKINSQQKIEHYSISGKISVDIFSNYYEGIELNAFGNIYLYSIGYYYGEDYGMFRDKPTENYHQLNILMGKYEVSKNKKFRFQYQVGIGAFWGIIRTKVLDESETNIFIDKYFAKKASTIGFPIKIGGRYIPFKFISLGIDIQTNINLAKSIIRPMLSVEIEI